MAAALAMPAAAQDAFDCVIDPSRRIELASPTGGIVAEILVDDGQTVQAGEVVARLASSVEEATVSLLTLQASDTSAVDAERSRLDFLEARLARREALAESGIVTRDRLEEIRAEVATSRSLLARAEMARKVAGQELVRAEAVLERTRLRSPISGTVTRRALDEGEYLHPEAHVIEILQLDPLQVEAFLPASAWGRVAAGDDVTVRLSAPVGGDYRATVKLVDQALDAASETFAILAELPNPEGAIPAGHRCVLDLAAG